MVANSLGCQVVAHCAVLAPQRITTLTLIGATIDPAAHRLSIQTLRLIRDAVREPPRLWLKWMYDFCRTGLRRALATTHAMFADYIEDQLPKVTSPTLVIRGGWDPTMPKSWGERAVALLPKGQLVVLPNEQHCVHFTRPVEVGNLIEGHIRQFTQ